MREKLHLFIELVYSLLASLMTCKFRFWIPALISQLPIPKGAAQKIRYYHFTILAKGKGKKIWDWFLQVVLIADLGSDLVNF